MSAEDAISHIPGAQAIANSANKVLSADVSGILKLKKGLVNAHSEALSSHRDLTTTLGRLPQHWEGSDHNSFQGYMKKFITVDKEAHELMKKGIKGLDDAVRKLDDAKTQLQSDLNAMAKDYDNRVRNAKKPVDTQSIGKAVIAAHKPAIDKEVKKYDQAMEELAQDLTTAISTPSSGGFGGIPSPGTGSTSTQSAPVNYGGSGTNGAVYTGGGGVAPDVHVSGDVQQWIEQAKKILAAHGIHLSDADIKALKLIIEHESGGNPNAINLTDSNAQAGHPSQGLMQTIPSTFHHYALPGYDSNIKDPVSNIIAGVRYSIARYGGLTNVPGVEAVAHGGGYVGY